MNIYNYYYDREGNPIDVLTWADLFNDRMANVVSQTRINEVLVSTVWMGLNHNWLGDGPPLIFETMIFGLDEDDEIEWQWRWSTKVQALAGHDQAVAQVVEAVAKRSDHVSVVKVLGF